MITASLNSFDKLDTLEELEQKKYKEKTRREPQLFVSTSKISASADIPQVYLLVDLPNPFDNPDLVALLTSYNPLDPFWSDQGISFGIPQISQGS
jgi:hypothetical protein